MNDLECPNCNRFNVLVARDTKSTRICQSCHHTWLPAHDIKPQLSIGEILNQKVFQYKGSLYRVISAIKIKSPIPGQWFDGITYRSEADRLGFQVYARTLEDFCLKFKAHQPQFEREILGEWKPQEVFDCKFRACKKQFVVKKVPEHGMIYCPHCGNKQTQDHRDEVLKS